MSKNLAVFLDGTFATKKVNTIAYRLYKNTYTQNQVKFYQEGLPLWRPFDALFGISLMKSIEDAYDFLVKNYEEGDKIYLFGYSRGAYAVRSLAGIIRKCGLLKSFNISMRSSVFRLYKNKDIPIDAEEVQNFRSRYCNLVDIQCLGVVDTVGSLGIPWCKYLPWSKEKFKFHNVTLFKNVRNAFQVLALDEYRPDWYPVVWDSMEDPGNTNLEQRWFVGSHSDIGYQNKEKTFMVETASYWLHSKVKETGLRLELPTKADFLITATPEDSYSKSLFGLYKFYALFQKKFRKALRMGIHETLDESVKDKYYNFKNYRPKSLDGLELNK